jgi:hypothetical protein
MTKKRSNATTKTKNTALGVKKLTYQEQTGAKFKLPRQTYYQKNTAKIKVRRKLHSQKFMAKYHSEGS